MDGSVDSLYPLLELYGDSLEELDLTMMRSQKPTAEHVNTSHLVKQRLQNIRRCVTYCPVGALRVLVRARHDVWLL